MRSIIFFLLAFLVSFCIPALDADTIHVPADSVTIQAGIDGADEGDTVLVADGIYYETIDFLGKAIVVRGENGPLGTVIAGDPEGSNQDIVSFVSGEGESSVLERFTIRKSTPQYNYRGIKCVSSSPTIKNNIIIENTNDIYCSSISSPTILNNYIGKSTQGIFCYDSSSPMIEDNVIVRNARAIHIAPYQMTPGSHPQIVHNLIGWNSGGEFPGILVEHYSEPLIEGNIIIGNKETYEDDWAGGIFIYDAEVIPTIRRNLILRNGRNYGGGIGFQFSMKGVVENNTICDNNGSGVFFEVALVDSIIVRNNIVSGNTRYGIAGYFYREGILDISYNDIWENEWGEFGWEASPDTGNISADPEFRLEDTRDYTLQASSPCIDAGDPKTPVPEGGGDRIDIGAFEYTIPYNDLALDFISVPDTVSRGDSLYLGISLTNPFQAPVMIDVWFTASGWGGSLTLRQFTDLQIPADTVITTTLSFPIPDSLEVSQYNLHGKVGYIDEWIADAENAVIQVVE